MENSTVILPRVNNFSISILPDSTVQTPPVGNATDASTPRNSNQTIYQGIFVSLLVFVMLAGFIGNTLVILTIRGKRSLWTPCNMFIMNIAIVDLLVAIILTPLRMTELFVGWPLGNLVCQIVGPMQDVIMCVSAVTHSKIAVERYRVIVTPFKVKLTLYKAKLTIAVSYGVCYILTGIPLALVLKQQENGGLKYCKAKWPSITYRRVYEVYLVMVFICLPLVIQTTSYVMILTRLKREDAQIQLTRSGTVEQRLNQVQKKARLVKMLIILVVVFQVCLIPRGTYILVKEFVSAEFTKQNAQLMKVVSIATIVMYYLKHVFNPLILFAMSAEFRKNCCICRTVCRNKLNVVSSILQHVSRQSDVSSDAKETMVLYDQLRPRVAREDRSENSETNV
ncbi:QRFP-like peptide receptor [Montipora capricornis]|uniref:QRFP-like peptide receptor n=1 Tax=Montipora capricornis TaxID=246305 RepID=UPI0035F16725